MIRDITKHLKLKDYEVIEYLGCVSTPYTCVARYKYKNKIYIWYFKDGDLSYWEE